MKKELDLRLENLPPFLTELKRFIEPPKPGEKPLIYFATRQQNQFDYPNRSENEPNLYRSDTMTIEEFMQLVFPYLEYGDYRDLVKSETWIMPGLDCYVVPQELNQSSLKWSFVEEVWGAMDSITQTANGPDWESAIDDALGIEKPVDENQLMMRELARNMAVLAPVFQQAGPFDLPHYHASICFGLDNYAQEWLGLSAYQIRDTQDQGKSPVQLFNEKYGHLNVRYGQMMTMRYTSYKDGKLSELLSSIQDSATRELGFEPDLIEATLEAFQIKITELLEQDNFRELWLGQANSNEGILAILDQLDDQDPRKKEVLDLMQSYLNFYKSQEKIVAATIQRFDQICRTAFGMSAEDFEKAYQAKLEWLRQEKDVALIDMAHRLGVSALLKKNMYELGLTTALSSDDFPPGGVVLHQNADERLEWQPSQMVVAYPAAQPIEDKPTIFHHQYEDALNEVLAGSGVVVISNDSALDQVRDHYIQNHRKFQSQYQIFTASEVATGQVTLEDINKSTGVIFITGLNQPDQNTAVIQNFIAQAWDTITTDGRKSHIGFRVVVFRHPDVEIDSLPAGTKKAHLIPIDRNVHVGAVSEV